MSSTRGTAPPTIDTRGDATTGAGPKVTLVAPSSPRRTGSGQGGHSPTSPLRPTNDMRFASETEYSATFSGSQLRESLRTSSYTRGNSSQPLWLSIGGQRYSTETSDKYSGHMPPPAAPRPVPKWQPNTLHLHGETTYGDSFVAYGASASKAEIHKPVAQTKPLPVPLSTSTEYRSKFHAHDTAASAPGSPDKRVRQDAKEEWRSPSKPFFGLTQYDESFAPGTLSATLKPALEAVEASSSGAVPISSPLRFGAAKEHAKAMGTSPMRATGTLGATSASPSRTGGAPPSSSTGSAARTSNIMKGRSATAYGELDGTGADPWKLMDMLGYEVPKPRAAKK